MYNSDAIRYKSPTSLQFLSSFDIAAADSMFLAASQGLVYLLKKESFNIGNMILT